MSRKLPSTEERKLTLNDIHILYRSLNLQAIHQVYVMIRIQGFGKAGKIMKEGLLSHETRKAIKKMVLATLGQYRGGVNDASSSLREHRSISLNNLFIFCKLARVNVLQLFRNTVVDVVLPGENPSKIRLDSLIGRWVLFDTSIYMRL